MSTLANNLLFTSALDYASGTADRNGAIIDMADHEGILMICKFATIAAGAVTSIKVQSGTDDALGDAADLLGTGQTIAADDDDQVFVIDLYKRRERYVRLVVDKDASNATAESAIYIRYGPRHAPQSVNVTDAVTVETHQSPAEGTA